MKYCSGCGSQIDDSYNSCPYCGQSTYSAAPQRNTLTIVLSCVLIVCVLGVGAVVLLRFHPTSIPVNVSSSEELSTPAVSSEMTFSSEENSSSFYYESEYEPYYEEPEQIAEYEPDVTVPDLKGLSLDSAEAILDKAGLSYSIKQQESTTEQDNIIIGQYPESGQMAEAGDEILLIVAKHANAASEKSSKAVSSPYADVPEVIGMTVEAAQEKLNSRSFKSDISYTYSETVANGCVISQNPHGGKAEKNSTVKLVVSKGIDPKQYVLLDNYVGKPIADVAPMLEKTGLTVTYSLEQSETIAEGCITRQVEKPNTNVKKGSTVNFYVSEGSGKRTSDAETDILTDTEIDTESISDNDSSTSSKPKFTKAAASSYKPKEGQYTYVPENVLTDNDSCWCENASGDGVGEYITLSADESQTVSGIRIKNGYTRDSTVFAKNGRASKITIIFSDGKQIVKKLDPDSMKAQDIAFDSPVDTKSIKIIISEVKTGSKYSDTCITYIDVY